MGKTKAKLAIIRSDEALSCPFGLGDIPTVCKHAGVSVKRMASVDDAEDGANTERMKKANMLVYIYNKTGKQCIYADKMLPNFDKVDCDYGDTGQGEHSAPLRGSPFYTQTFRSLHQDGIHGYPLGYMTDNQSSMRGFFGLFSYMGSTEITQLIKLADLYDETGDHAKSAQLDLIIEKLEGVRDEPGHQEAIAAVAGFLDEHGEQPEAEEKIESLTEKWFGLDQTK